MASIEDFKKLELRIAKIVEVNPHSNADRLFVLKIDLGDCTRQIVAGIKSGYREEELINRQIVVIANLESAEIRGVKSEGMLLAASDETGISILSPDRELKLGSIVK